MTSDPNSPLPSIAPPTTGRGRDGGMTETAAMEPPCPRCGGQGICRDDCPSPGGNFDALRDFTAEARKALDQMMPPTPAESANQYAALYYPLLFLTATSERILTHVLRQAHDAVRDENEAAAKWLDAAALNALTAAHPRDGDEQENSGRMNQ